MVISGRNKKEKSQNALVQILPAAARKFTIKKVYFLFLARTFGWRRLIFRWLRRKAYYLFPLHPPSLLLYQKDILLDYRHKGHTRMNNKKF